MSQNLTYSSSPLVTTISFYLRLAYIMDDICDENVVYHPFVGSFLEDNELAASYKADVTFAVADYEIGYNLVAR